jgi:endonuclease YncB( thermonuclease family)
MVIISGYTIHLESDGTGLSKFGMFLPGQEVCFIDHFSPLCHILIYYLTALKDQTIHIRIAGADAPEAAHFGKPAQPGADEALAWLKGMIDGKSIWCQLVRKDQYSRVVSGVSFALQKKRELTYESGVARLSSTSVFTWSLVQGQTALSRND